jgi:hypothetical protein
MKLFGRPIISSFPSYFGLISDRAQNGDIVCDVQTGSSGFSGYAGLSLGIPE